MAFPLITGVRGSDSPNVGGQRPPDGLPSPPSNQAVGLALQLALIKMLMYLFHNQSVQ